MKICAQSFAKAFVDNGLADSVRLWVSSRFFSESDASNDSLKLLHSFPEENTESETVSTISMPDEIKKAGYLFHPDTSLFPFSKQHNHGFRSLFLLKDTGLIEIIHNAVQNENDIQFSGFTATDFELLKPLFDRFSLHFQWVANQAAENRKVKNNLAEKFSNEETQQSIIATLSHEFRNPLNIILGYLDFLSETKLSRDQADYVDVISETSQGLYYTVKKIFQFVTLTLDKVIYDQQSFNLPALFGRIEKMIGLYARKKNLALHFSIDPALQIQFIEDVSKLTDILIYLIENAIKFTSIGEVNVSARLISQTNTEANVRFEVTDTGKGIDREHIQQIFEFFGQEDDSITRQYGGLGLGLSIADQYIQKLGGKLELKSESEKGTSVVFKLKLNKDPQAKANLLSVERIDQSIAKNIKVLLVDDDVYQRNIGQHILEDWNTFTADNGKEAVEFLKQNLDTQLVLMDIRMPVLDGISATRIIRKELKSNAVIIAVSGEVQEATIEECLAAGMNDFVSKPFNKGKLLQKIISRLHLTPQHKDVSSVFNPERLDGMRCLVVEDDKMNQLLSARYLKDLGCVYDMAETGEAALEFYQSNTYNFVLLDLHLPDTDGMKLAKKLKAINNSCCLIAYTGHDSEYIRNACSAAGIDDLILKQYRKAPELASAIHHVLEKYHIRLNKKSESLMSELYNLSLLDEIVSGNQEELLDIIKTFLDYTVDMLDVLRNLDPSNLKEVKITAHSLVSSAKQFQMRDIIPVLQQMEHETADLSVQEIQDLINRTIVFLGLCKDQMQQQFFSDNS